MSVWGYLRLWGLVQCAVLGVAANLALATGTDFPLSESAVVAGLIASTILLVGALVSRCHL